jgi:hypothetical protein
MVDQSKIAGYFSLDFLKPYFQVTHSYILQKARNVFFPFMYKEGAEDIYSDNEPTRDRDRIEYPDFYLPMMSFITYILLITLNMVNITQSRYLIYIYNRLDPEWLGYKATKNILIVLLHTIILKFGKFLINF